MLVSYDSLVGCKVSIVKLLNEGWKKVVYIGHNGLILSKGDHRIVYSFTSRGIITHYKSRPIIGC